MSYQNLLEEFAEAGRLALPDGEVALAAVPWAAHPSFAGVELKQLETHEVIAGSGFCLRDGQKIAYEPGIICLLPAAAPHLVQAGPDGLYLFAKFIPALS